jgi:putative transposase
VNEPQSETELTALRQSLRRGAPFGDEHWQKSIAKSLGIESTLRPQGRHSIETTIEDEV